VHSTEQHGPVESRLAEVLRLAADGRFPPADGKVERLASPKDPVGAVLAFTGHHLVAADVDRRWLSSALPAGDLSAPVAASFLVALSRHIAAHPRSLDVVLAAVGDGAPPELALEEAAPGFTHPRLARATRYRREVRAFHDADGAVLVLGRGLAGRNEVAIELDARSWAQGRGRALARSALGLVPPGEAVFAQVAPGNAASIRCFLSAGYRPIGAEVLFAAD
jgi:hypothetical protein